jgi:DNA topoisomerase-1
MPSTSATAEPLDPVQSAKEVGLRYVSCAQPGIKRRKSGGGFRYIDETGHEIRDRKTLERIRALVLPPAWTDVWICAQSNGHLQATGYDARGRKQYRYHSAYRQARDANKFGRMLAFAESLPRIRRHVARDLRLPGLPKRKVVAAVVNLLDRTCIRVGNDEYVRQNDSYGLTTLHDRHVDVSAGHMTFRFRGKSGQYHEIGLTDPKLAAIVKQCRDIPGRELFQYRDDRGAHARIDSSDVNEYIHEISGQDFTAKDFRTWHGTGHALEYLTKLERARTQTQQKRNLLAAIKETAQFLGNRPATCRKYYIHPAVTDGYSDGSIFAVVESCSKVTARHYEAATKLLVERYLSRTVS